MSSRLIVDVLDPEQQAEKNAQVLADNAAREKVRLAAKNRASGQPEPKPGDRLYVQLQVGISARSRAGVVFVANKRTVIEVFDRELPEKRDGVDAFVTADQAEQILADTALTVGARSGGDLEGAQLRAENDRLQAEVDDMRAKLREARMNAKDAGDGKPARLNAARAVGGAPPKAKDDDFGGEKA